MITPVKTILSKWPSRLAVLEDARKAFPDLQEIAIYRWEKRGSIPAKYLDALATGAAKRRIGVKIKDLVQSNSQHGDQSGQSAEPFQPRAPQNEGVDTNSHGEGAS